MLIGLQGAQAVSFLLDGSSISSHIVTQSTHTRFETRQYLHKYLHFICRAPHIVKKNLTRTKFEYRTQPLNRISHITGCLIAFAAYFLFTKPTVEVHAFPVQTLFYCTRAQVCIHRYTRLCHAKRSVRPQKICVYIYEAVHN